MTAVGLELTVLSGADEPLSLPAMALFRSVHDAVLQTCWSLEADVATEQRLARWAIGHSRVGGDGACCATDTGPSTDTAQRCTAMSGC